ncbi:MAG: DUF1587 domain-containing protein, partial [Planctomycetia bacterium]
MNTSMGITGRFFLCIAAACTLAIPVLAEDVSDSFQRHVLPVLKAHCTDCHGEDKKNAKVDFATPRTPEQIRADADLWFRMLEQVESGTMPPPETGTLMPLQRKAVIDWVRGPLCAELAETRKRDGRSHLRRLSREEWANTVFDILGIRPAVGRFLPPDGRVDGYDKVSAALPFSATGMEGFMKTAEDTILTLLDSARAHDPKTNGTVRVWAKPSEQSKGHLLE